MKDLEIGQTYLNRHAAKTFVHFIAQSLRNELKEAYETAKFLAVMSDGSTDSAVEEQEIVYCRFGTGGKVYTQFLAVQTVKKADAQTISLAIDSAVSSTLDQNWKDKLAAIGTDGAAVMVGKNTGVVKRLKGDSDYIIGVHCMNHRLELAFKDATGKNPCHKRLTEELLLGLYLFYKNSALNRANLKESFATLGQPVLIPTRVGGTRWLSHLQTALMHFLRGYKAITQHLKQVLNFCSCQYAYSNVWIVNIRICMT